MTTYRTFNAGEKRTMTKSQERAVERAFDRYDSDAQTVRVPQLEHLRCEFRPAVCCKHDWLRVDATPEKLAELSKRFDEPNLGPVQAVCAHCGTLALIDTMEDRFGSMVFTLWAMDSLVMEKQQVRDAARNARKERRA
jgi:hypothetical protein